MKKNVLLGVCGGIAVYKACEIVSGLVKLGYGVKVVMTEHASEFVSSLTFETLSKNYVVKDMFADKPRFEVEHISLAKWADVFLVAPATENAIAKFAAGICDDMLTTSFASSQAMKIVCPAMNKNMYLSEANLKNVEILKSRGVRFIDPVSGRLACGDVGIGRMEEPSEIIKYVDGILTPNPDFRGKKVLVTAGATVEDIDGVRFISNYSSGKMGMAIADAVISRGGDCTVICGRVSVAPPEKAERVDVKSTVDMYDAVMSRINACDVAIMSAAPADYCVKNRFDKKCKSENLTLDLVKNPDIAKAVGKIKGNKVLVAFAAETNDLIENAVGKLRAKNADMIVANDVTKEGAGFDRDTDIATIIYADGREESLPLMPKRQLADCILDGILSL